MDRYGDPQYWARLEALSREYLKQLDRHPRDWSEYNRILADWPHNAQAARDRLAQFQAELAAESTPVKMAVTG